MDASMVRSETLIMGHAPLFIFYVLCFFTTHVWPPSSLPRPTPTSKQPSLHSKARHLWPSVGWNEPHSQHRLNLFSTCSGPVQTPAGRPLMRSAPDPIRGLVRSSAGEREASDPSLLAGAAPHSPQKHRAGGAGGCGWCWKLCYRLFDGIKEIHMDNEDSRNWDALSFNHLLPFLDQTLGF